MDIILILIFLALIGWLIQAELKALIITIIIALTGTSVNATEELYNKWIEYGYNAALCIGQNDVISDDYLDEVITTFGEDKTLELIALGKKNSAKLLQIISAGFDDKDLKPLWAHKLEVNHLNESIEGQYEGWKIATNNYELKGLEYTVRTYLNTCK